MLSLGVGGAEFAAAFELSLESVSLFQSVSVGTAALEMALGAPGIVLLLVVVGLLGAKAEKPNGEFARAESEAIAQLDVALRQSRVLRARLETRRIRAVAVALDPASGQAHWLGEHPEQARILTSLR